MRLHRLIFISGLAVLMTGCAPRSIPPQDAKSPAESRQQAGIEAQSSTTAEVIAASKAIVAAFGNDDPNTYFKLFSPEATFIFHTTPRRLGSRSDYEQEWASWRRDLGFRVRSCKSSDQQVQLFGDLAILTHFVVTEVTTKQGDETLHERETIIFQRRDGQWVAVHEHLSPQP